MTAASAARASAFKKSRALCWAILLASGVTYGSAFSFTKIAVGTGANPLGLVFWFAVLATGALGVELAVLGRLRGLDAGLLSFCVPWGILSVPNLFFFRAAQEIPASLIALGIALVPILTLLGAILLKREKLTLLRTLGLALGAVGAMMVLLPKTRSWPG